MSVSVVFPYRSGCVYRTAAYDWVHNQYQAAHPEWERCVGVSPEGPFNRAAAILDGARQATGDVLVVSDADVWCDNLSATIEAAVECGWAVPHRLIHRLSPESTSHVLTGAGWRGLPLSTDNPQDRKPYVGNEAGTLLAVRRDALQMAPPDPRFAGWGQEDTSWSAALRTLVGAPWRDTADLVHLWHPPQARQSRTTGNHAGKHLARRYSAARRKPDAMRALIDEGRQAWTLATS